MNKKSLMIMDCIVLLLLISQLSYHVVNGGMVIVPEESLQEIDYFEVANALNAFEMIGEEKMRKDSSVTEFLNNIDSPEDENWEKIENLQSAIEKLEEELWYRSDVHLQLSILYSLQQRGKHLFGHVVLPVGTSQGVSKGIFVDDESEIADRKNELELLREDRIGKQHGLEELYMRRDPTLISSMKELSYELQGHEYTTKRYFFLHTVLLFKLKHNESLEITPSWEEGEHYLSPEKDHVWVGMYDSSAPGVTNFLGYYITNTFTSDMNYYWEETLKNNPETKSIRIKWIYTAKGQRIVWEGNKNKEKEWYTFAEYESDPEAGTYTVVNMNLLNYPEYQQYYVVRE
ncbi:MAG: hypothetical protein U9N35_00165 [Euryarchaeota archaeon]|nr:hypothetical protein [Euryarchaeota archaeon]